MRRIVGGLSAVAICFALVACQSGGSDEEPEQASPLDRDDTAVEATWRTELDVIGQPAVAEGVAVVLSKASKDYLAIVAVDVETGEELWTKPWSPGNVPTGFGMDPLTFTSQEGRAVTAFSDPGSDSPSPVEQEMAPQFYEPIVVVDLRTGEELHRTERMQISTPLAACADEKDVCIDGSGEQGSLRLDLDTGDLSSAAGEVPADARGIGGAGLFATLERPGEEIGVYRDGQTVWSRPTSEVIGDGVLSDGGWAFDHDEEADRYVGYMNQPFPAELEEKARAGEGYSIGADRKIFVGIDGKTGETLWTRDSETQLCVGLDDEAEVAVRCVTGGTIVYPGDGEVGSVEDATTTVEGYDPETGDTTWSFDLTPEAAEDVIFSRSTQVSDGRTLVLDTADGRLVVAVEDGESKKASASAAFACEGEQVTLDYAVPVIYDGESITRRLAGSLLSPCLADGTAADSFTESSARDAGADAGDDTYVLATAGGLEGYAITPSE